MSIAPADGLVAGAGLDPLVNDSEAVDSDDESGLSADSGAEDDAVEVSRAGTSSPQPAERPLIVTSALTESTPASARTAATGKPSTTTVSRPGRLRSMVPPCSVTSAMTRLVCPCSVMTTRAWPAAGAAVTVPAVAAPAVPALSATAATVATVATAAAVYRGTVVTFTTNLSRRSGHTPLIHQRACGIPPDTDSIHTCASCDKSLGERAQRTHSASPAVIATLVG